ncbi:MAG: hypothetical protein ACM3O3_05390 [Syntrophothermus sp.]
MNNKMTSYYKFPSSILEAEVTGTLSKTPGFFNFNDIICFGKINKPEVLHTNYLDDRVRKITGEIVFQDKTCFLPFDIDEIIENYWYEKFIHKNPGSPLKNLANKTIRATYYSVRPFMPLYLRKHMQKFSMRNWKDIQFPRWPLDTSTEDLFELILTEYLKANPGMKIPFIWFWPEGKNSAIMMTHDVEEEMGRSNCIPLMNMEEKYGVRSSFQLVPEVRYFVTKPFLNEVTSRGFEVCLHGLCHDGRLFQNKDIFLKKLKKIHEYANDWGAIGFRSPILYRNLEWYHHFEFKYDMSVPNVGNIDPQKGGCCTVMPYNVGKIVELPLTTLQDHPLYYYLNDYSIDIWRNQFELINSKHGLTSFIIHPDYTISNMSKNNYDALLSFLAKKRDEENVWFPLPKEIYKWRALRDKMELVNKDGVWEIEGEGKENARIAFAELVNNKLKYTIGENRRDTDRKTSLAEENLAI